METLKYFGKILLNVLIQIFGVIIFLIMVLSDEYGRWYYSNAVVEFFENIFK